MARHDLHPPQKQFEVEMSSQWRLGLGQVQERERATAPICESIRCEVSRLDRFKI